MKITNFITQIGFGLAVCVAVGGCRTRGNQQTHEQPDQQAQRAPTAQPDDPELQQAEQYIDQTVTVSGEVDQIYSPTLIKLEDVSGLWAKKIIAVTDSDAMVGHVVEEGTTLRLTGKIKRMTVAEVERDHNVDLGRDLESEIERFPLLVVERFEVVHHD